MAYGLACHAGPWAEGIDALQANPLPDLVDPMTRVQDALKAREAAQADLLAAVREAKEAGATVAQLMQWTGYSRRTIFYMLKDKP